MTVTGYDHLVDIKDILVSNSIGILGQTLFISKEPLNPDFVITLYQTNGRDPDPKFAINYPSFQVRVRGTVDGYQAAYAKCRSIIDVLLGSQTIVNATTGDSIVGIYQTGDVIFLKYDDANRPVLVLNFRLIVQPSNLGNRKAL